MATSNSTLIKHLACEHNMHEVKPVDKSQRVLSEMFKPKEKAKSSGSSSSSSMGDQKYVVSRQLATMCALDFEPFSLPERKGFNLFCKWHNINDLPTAQNVSDTALLDVYAFFKSKIIAILESPTHIGLTLDCWTDGHKRRAYIVYRAHFIMKFKTINCGKPKNSLLRASSYRKSNM